MSDTDRTGAEIREAMKELQESLSKEFYSFRDALLMVNETLQEIVQAIKEGTGQV